MINWSLFSVGRLRWTFMEFLREKKVYLQSYEKTLMRWGSGLFWMYLLQCVTGVLLSLAYMFAFDTGLPTIAYIWWETSHGSFLMSLHSEVGNMLFCFLYLHIFTKVWTSIDTADADGYSTWITGSCMFIFTYMAGVTGAMMPCSILGEVTATIAGSAVSSLMYMKFDFLETLIVPGMALNEDAIWRSYIIHALMPLLTFLMGIYHMLVLHQNKYSAAGGLKSMSTMPRLRETRRWRYINSYWNSPFGSWYSLLIYVMVLRFMVDFSWPGFMAATYGASNYEYWPISETIDFVLAIPHWYLRPLMGALVTMPHHYLGFMYMGCFFMLIMSSPWSNERNDDDTWGFSDAVDGEGWATTRWDIVGGLVCLTFLCGSMFTIAIVPTGKFFISLGSMDGLIVGYWIALFYVFFLVSLNFYLMSLFFSSFKFYKCVN